MKVKIISVIAVLLVFAASAYAAEPETETAKKLPKYVPQELAEGTLTSVGSDSMHGLVGRWVEAYKLRQPLVEVQITSRGSASAPPALIEGYADLGPMARPMKSPEVTKFEQKYGFQPTQIRTAIAAVAVYVPANNPLNQISFEQLDAIYSSARKRGSEKTNQKLV